jgi:hypothetical protein
VTRRAATLLTAAVALVGARRGGAQPLELRAEAAVGRHPAALVGAGATADAGLYVRLGVLAGVGVADRRGPGRRGGAGPAAEVAAVARFLLDPLRQAARGVYAGGGVGFRAADGEGTPFLVAVAGVEGRRRRGLAPAVELGVGGGVRVTAVLRRARRDRR